MITLVLTLLFLASLYYLYYFIQDFYQRRHSFQWKKLWIGGAIGFITDFLDTLGIGSFAPTTILLNWTKTLDDDRQLPGTLNVAHTLPVVLEAFIFTTVIQVDLTTLCCLVLAAVIGSVYGARFVNRLSQQKVQRYMGIALFLTALLMICKQLGWLALLGQGKEATALHGGALLLACLGNALFGALQTLGVGLYAPCMAMISLLGLSPLVSFPIMMLSCAAVLPVASTSFIKEKNYQPSLALGIMLFGLMGVFVAANIVTHLNLTVLTWVVIIVILYTAFSYLRKSSQSPVNAL